MTKCLEPQISKQPFHIAAPMPDMGWLQAGGLLSSGSQSGLPLLGLVMPTLYPTEDAMMLREGVGVGGEEERKQKDMGGTLLKNHNHF